LRVTDRTKFTTHKSNKSSSAPVQSCPVSHAQGYLKLTSEVQDWYLNYSA